MNPSPFVSVIVPAFNEEEHIEKCLQSLRNQDYDSGLLEIILIDNGSSDETVERATDLAHVIKIIPGINVGAVRNRGVSIAQGEYVAFIDADCTAPPDWIRNAVGLISSQHLSAVGGGCDLDQNAAWIERLWLLEQPHGKRVPKDFIGCAIVANKSAFEKVGGFNEEVTSGEDTQLSMDLKKHGLKIAISSEVNVTHLGNALTTTAFIKRQIWHSENYVKDLTNSLRDPTFFLVVIFSALVVYLALNLLLSRELNVPLFLSALIIPMIFSLKRIKRSKNLKYLLPKNILRIYYLDALYLSGRALGLAKGLLMLLKPTGR